MCGVLEQAPAPALQSTTADLRVTNLRMPPRHQCGGKQPLLRRVGWNASRSTALSVWCVTVWCGMCLLEPVGVTAQAASCDCTTDPAVVLRHIECVTLQFNSTPCDDLDDSVGQRPSMQHTTHLNLYTVMQLVHHSQGQHKIVHTPNPSIYHRVCKRHRSTAARAQHWWRWEKDLHQRHHQILTP